MVGIHIPFSFVAFRSLAGVAWMALETEELVCELFREETEMAMGELYEKRRLYIPDERRLRSNPKLLQYPLSCHAIDEHPYSFCILEYFISSYGEVDSSSWVNTSGVDRTLW
jgi:hypothetical protein